VLLVKTEVRDSPIEGKGLFVLERVRRGTLIAIFTSGGAIAEGGGASPAVRYGVMTEHVYLEKMTDDDVVRYSGARYVREWFVYKDAVHAEDFTNHDDDPNVLYHCGLGFARRDLETGDELTCDYRFFFSSDDYMDLGERKIWGHPADVALRKSTAELHAIIGAGRVEDAAYPDHARERA
jgi:hypothetical protein